MIHRALERRTLRALNALKTALKRAAVEGRRGALGTVVLALLLLASSACASAPPPETALAAVTAEGESVPLDSITAEFEVGGVRVIHRPAWANEVVAVNLYLLGGSRQLTHRTAGIESLLLRASEYGTRSYPGERARRAEGLTGSRIVVRPEADWTIFGFHGIVQEFDSTWAVFADRLMHPSLDSAGVEVSRAKMLTAARSARDTPDGSVSRLADSVAYGAHPYAKSPWGTEESLRAITIDDLRRYHAGQTVTSRMLLVVVGNVTRERLEHAVARTLGRLPRGDYQWTPPATWGDRIASEDDRAIAVNARPLPTNYILGYFAGPPASHEDHAAFRLATAILGAQIHTRIRNEGLSYAAYAPFLERGASGGGVYVSTVAPQASLQLINDIIDGVRRRPLARASLSTFAEQFIMDYFQENATNAAQADFLARSQLHRGDWRLASQYMAELRRVTPTQVRQAAQRYIRDISWAYVGDTAKIPAREMERFGRKEE